MKDSFGAYLEEQLKNPKVRAAFEQERISAARPPADNLADGYPAKVKVRVIRVSTSTGSPFR